MYLEYDLGTPEGDSISQHVIFRPKSSWWEKPISRSQMKTGIHGMRYKGKTRPNLPTNQPQKQIAQENSLIMQIYAEKSQNPLTTLVPQFNIICTSPQ